jgi:hypothetical protein
MSASCPTREFYLIRAQTRRPPGTRARGVVPHACCQSVARDCEWWDRGAWQNRLKELDSRIRLWVCHYFGSVAHILMTFRSEPKESSMCICLKLQAPRQSLSRGLLRREPGLSIASGLSVGEEGSDWGWTGALHPKRSGQTSGLLAVSTGLWGGR